MTFSPHALLLYKTHPARLLQRKEKLEIELEDGTQLWVRHKDVTVLHPGPLNSLRAFQVPPGEVQLAWEILSETPETPHDLKEVAELVYGAFTPDSAWATWKLVEDGLYFHGTPQAILTRSPDEVTIQKAARSARQREVETWLNCVERARQGQLILPEDSIYLRELEELAYGRRTSNRLLNELGLPEHPESAHNFLLSSNYWSVHTNPYPTRLRLPKTAPGLELPPLPDEPRLDLTGLAAYAIDDRENRDPDDALSLESIQMDAAGNLQGGQLWVHIADVAALVMPDSPVDLEARGRGATLYLPEGPVTMLPAPAVDSLGLGLQAVSPALSFGITLDAQGMITDVEIRPSWVQVQRLSYEQADEQLKSNPHLQALSDLANVYQTRRKNSGALAIDLPEVIIRVINDQVSIHPVLQLHSRSLVREAMLMAGEAAARFASQNHLLFPFATQDAPDAPLPQIGENDLAGFFSIRKQLKRGAVSSRPGLHAGLGLEVYSRVTSPLRRYLDLVAHQQLRACLTNTEALDEQAMLERLGAAELIVNAINQAEALSRRHWTLVYFLQNPGWQGEAVLVEKQGLKGKIIIPELAFETTIYLRQDIPLNSRFNLKFKAAKLAELEASFVQ